MSGSATSSRITAKKPSIIQSIPGWCFPALLCLVFTIVGWKFWVEPLVDFGREVHVASRVAGGQTLYEDVFYFNGPLSPTINATAFRIFGENLQTLIFLNFLFLVLLIRLMWGTLRELSSSRAATFTCILFVLIFPFSNINGFSIFNYLAPYSHEATHGHLLIWALLGLQLKQSLKKPWWIDPTSGILMSLLLLCKTELALTGAVCLITALLVRLFLHGKKAAGKTAFTLFCGLACSLMLFLIFATATVSKNFAIHSLTDLWKHLGNREISSMQFYQVHLGFDNWLGNLKSLLWVAIIYVWGLGSAWIGVKYLSRIPRTMVLATLPLVMAFFCYQNLSLVLMHGGKPLQVILFTSIVYLGLNFLKKPTLMKGQWIIALATALAMLLKIILNIRPYNYGFTLAAPAAMLVVLLVTHVLPEQLNQRGFAGKEFAITLWVTLLIYSLPYLWLSHRNFGYKTTPYGSGKNLILADRRGAHHQKATDWILSNTPEDSTLLSLPEVTLINLMTHRKNPTSIANLMPPEYIMQGSENILHQLEIYPPDYILITHKDTSEYGFQYFGNHYAADVGQWILKNYKPVFSSGERPFRRPRGFGVMIWQHQPQDQSDLL